MVLNVLIVDDSSVMRAMILKTMRMSGLPLGELYEAGNGQEGLETLKEHWIDIVVADINMPVMNGEEMIDYMKTVPELRDIPVIIISTEGSDTRIENLQDKSAAFIHKPFSPETIRDTVRQIITLGDHDERAD